MKTKQFKSGKNQVILESFDSITEFTDINNSRPNTKEMKYKDSSSSGSKSFTGTSSFEEADLLLRNGYVEGVKELSSKVKAFATNTSKPKTNYRPVGSSPSVGRFLSGNPNCMRHTQRVKVETPCVKVFVNCSYSHFYSTNQIISHGVVVFDAIQKLESKGIRTEIHIVQIVENNSHIAVATIKIKDGAEKLNLTKCTYPMIHPSWLRRHVLKWFETTPACDFRGFNYGYGRPLMGFDSVRAMKNGRIISDNDLYFDIYLSNTGAISGQELIDKSKALVKNCH